MGTVRRLTPTQVRNRKKWTKALRSGKYKQGKSRLRRPEPDGTFSYCCLGVACAIGLAPNSNLVDGTVLVSADENALMVRGVLADRGDGLVNEDGYDTSVMFEDMNDDLGFTFDEIADCIDLDTWYRAEENA